MRSPSSVVKVTSGILLPAFPEQAASASTASSVENSNPSRFMIVTHVRTRRARVWPVRVGGIQAEELLHRQGLDFGRRSRVSRGSGCGFRLSGLLAVFKRIDKAFRGHDMENLDHFVHAFDPGCRDGGTLAFFVGH